MPVSPRYQHAILLLAGSMLAALWLGGMRPPAIAPPDAGEPPAAVAGRYGRLLPVTGPGTGRQGGQGTAARVEPLTGPGSLDGFPAWSPDGRLVAFMRDGDIWVMDARGQGARPLTRAGGWDVVPAFAPDGRRVAFVRIPPEGEEPVGELRTVTLDGQEQLLVREAGLVGYIAFVPGGREIAYTTRTQVRLHDLRTRTSRVLVEMGPEMDLLPGGLAFTPDGGSVIFGAGRRDRPPDGLQTELYRARLAAPGPPDAGGPAAPAGPPAPEPLTREGGIMPDVSPDGRRVAFRDPRGSPGIYVLDLATGQVTARLRDAGAYMYFHPRWSPDGQALILSRLEIPRAGQGNGHLQSRIVVLQGG